MYKDIPAASSPNVNGYVASLLVTDLFRDENQHTHRHTHTTAFAWEFHKTPTVRFARQYSEHERTKPKPNGPVFCTLQYGKSTAGGRLERSHSSEARKIAELVPLVLSLAGTLEGARCLRVMVGAKDGVGEAVQSAILREGGNRTTAVKGGGGGDAALGVGVVVYMLVR